GGACRGDLPAVRKEQDHVGRPDQEPTLTFVQDEDLDRQNSLVTHVTVKGRLLSLRLDIGIGADGHHALPHPERHGLWLERLGLRRRVGGASFEEEQRREPQSYCRAAQGQSLDSMVASHFGIHQLTTPALRSHARTSGTSRNPAASLVAASCIANSAA